MVKKNNGRDKCLIFLFILLIAIGWLNVFSVSFNGTFSFKSSYGRQLIWIIISCTAALFLSLINSRFYRNITPSLYIVTLILVLAAAFIGKKTNGASSWLVLGGFGIQPAEFAKYSVCLMLANYLSKPNTVISKRKTLWTSIAIITIPIICILLQNDMGSAIPFVFLILALYREGLTIWVLIVILIMLALLIMTLLIKQWITVLIVTLIFALIFWKIRKHKKFYFGVIAIYCITVIYTFSTHVIYQNAINDYQKDRIETVLGLKDDPKGTGYNVNQSKIAIGSGGLFGQGFMKGTQTAMNFIPEQSTDFIFCTIGEEWGFVGSTLLILIYAFLIGRIVFSAEEQKDPFIRIYGYCIACIFFSHLMINIGMILGLLPVIGIPLPFISYGGSALLAYTFMLFTFITLDSQSNTW